MLAPTRRDTGGARRPALLPDAKSIKPSEVVIVILDIILMALVSATIESLLMWSICTQYRDGGCEHPESAGDYRSR